MCVCMYACVYMTMFIHQALIPPQWQLTIAVCMYVCMYVSMYAYCYASVHECIKPTLHIYIYIYIYIYMYAYIHMYINVRTQHTYMLGGLALTRPPWCESTRTALPLGICIHTPSSLYVCMYVCMCA